MSGQKQGGKNKKFGRNKRAASTKMQQYRTARNKDRAVKNAEKEMARHVRKWKTLRSSRQVRGYARRVRRQAGAVAVVV